MCAKPLYAAALAAAIVMGSAPAAADVKKVPYPAVKVELSEAYKPDAAFETMRKSFTDAVGNKDNNIIFALVAPGFVWNTDGALSGDTDLGRDPLHNFKVLFGFRDFGKDSDGGVEGGPFWDALNIFAMDGTYYKDDQNAGLVCSPMAAKVADEDKLAQARSKIETGDDGADWYFVLRETRVMKSPGDKGLPIATVSNQAFPVLSPAPQAREGESTPEPAHYEILLPNGKTGWIPAAAARPLETNRLCYAKTEKGEWKIALYDGLAQDEDDDNGNGGDDEDKNRNKK